MSGHISLYWRSKTRTFNILGANVMVITASASFSSTNFLTFFSVCCFFVVVIKKILKMTSHIGLSNVVVNDLITNITNYFSSYLMVINTLKPIVFKNCERNF